MIRDWFANKKKQWLLNYFSGSDTQLGRQMRSLQLQNHKQSLWILLLLFIVVVLSGLLLWYVLWRPVDLVVLHQAADGSAWVTQQRGSLKPNEAATRANIANYVRLRESYAADSFAFQYRQVIQQSSPAVSVRFRRGWSIKNKGSLLHRLGRDGIRKIKIDDIILLPFKTVVNKQSSQKHPFAEVHYTTIDIKPLQKTPVVRSHRVIISWSYRGLPLNPEERLTNWMGFQVRYYRAGE
jgi:type IV secretory pathway component VirB8